MKKKIYGWHFVADTLRDGSPIPKDGEWLEYKGKVKMCQSGLHFSDTPAQALQYAPGAILCYVELENVVQRDSDKGVCSRRKIIARMDSSEVCRYFARMRALSVLDNWEKEPDQVVLEWLLTGDESTQLAARLAARLAAGSAARLAAWSAAGSAAGSAAWSAARSAAGSAAWSAARLAAGLAAGSAAGSAAWSAAGAAWLAAGSEFNSLVYECFEGVLEKEPNQGELNETKHNQD